MPLILRESGSFGTHWMLQDRVTVQLRDGETVTVTGEEVIGMLRALYGGRPELPTGDVRRVLESLRQSGEYSQQWRDLERMLGGR